MFGVKIIGEVTRTVQKYQNSIKLMIANAGSEVSGWIKPGNRRIRIRPSACVVRPFETFN